MDPHDFDRFNVTSWPQVQHAVSEEQQAGHAGQEGFEQHLAEARRPDPAPVASGGPMGSYYPHLSREDRDLIDKAIAQHAGSRNASTVSNYAAALRRLVNDLRGRGQSPDLRDHQSLLNHAKACFPEDQNMKAALQLLRAYHEPGYVAGGRQRAVPSAEDARLIERLTKPSGLTPGSFAIYQRRLCKFSETLKGEGRTISGLDHGSRLEFACKLFPKDPALPTALRMLRELNAEHVSGAGGPREAGGHGVPSPRLDGVPEEVWHLFDDEAEEPPTDPLELQRLEQGFREELQGRRDSHPAQSFFVDPEEFTFNPKQFSPGELQRLLDDEPAPLGVSSSSAPADQSAYEPGPLPNLSMYLPLDFQHGPQWASEDVMEGMRLHNLLPSASQPETNFPLKGVNYTATLGPPGHEDQVFLRST
ncbi:hypothetical protein [Bradyrhizobium sp. USDA 10063]